jgi:GNAT acetyltransferase-like protein
MTARDDAKPLQEPENDDPPESAGWRPDGMARALLGGRAGRGRLPSGSGTKDDAPPSELRPFVAKIGSADTESEGATSDRSPDSQGPASWRHLRPNVDDTVTDLAVEGWTYSRPSTSPLAAADAEEEEAPEPVSSRHPLSSWQPKQRYPSYPPPRMSRPPGAAFAIKVLDTSAELIQSYRLRYEVYSSMGYAPSNRASLEIDEYDPFSIPFGAIAMDTREIVGTLRLITNRVQPFYEHRIRRILDFCKDRVLSAQVRRPRRRPMPSITSDLIQEKLAEFNRDGQAVEEVSRGVTHASHRGTGVSRGLMEFGFAYAMTAGDPILVAGCVPAHLALNGTYGYIQLPGTGVEVNDVVDRTAVTIVCNMRTLPEPTKSRVAGIVEAMQWGEPECLLETGVEQGPKSRYHFRDGIILRPGRAASNR